RHGIRDIDAERVQTGLARALVVAGAAERLTETRIAADARREGAGVRVDARAAALVVVGARNDAFVVLADGGHVVQRGRAGGVGRAPRLRRAHVLLRVARVVRGAVEVVVAHPVALRVDARALSDLAGVRRVVEHGLRFAVLGLRASGLDGLALVRRG